MVLRLPWLKQTGWNLVVLDEAQAIKNPGARQSRAVKELEARHRIVLTGTPIENRLSDLWSLFDFICPGLLGSAREFATFLKNRSAGDQTQFGALRRLVRPYILRRLKTDKRVISDLPEKTEMVAFCSLTRAQAALYQQSVAELAERLEAAGSRRHPAPRHHPGVPDPVQTNLQSSFPMAWRCGLRPGGQRQVPAPARVVRGDSRAPGEGAGLHPIPRDDRTPGPVPGGRLWQARPHSARRHCRSRNARNWWMISSARAARPFSCSHSRPAAPGLNLTAASHVIHFDRWWNPAVENQATDRAFRIGQKRNVMVHKFTCRGTVEENDPQSDCQQDFPGGGYIR